MHCQVKSCLNTAICLRDDGLFSAQVTEFCVCGPAFYGEHCEFEVAKIAADAKSAIAESETTSKPGVASKSYTRKVRGNDYTRKIRRSRSHGHLKH